METCTFSKQKLKTLEFCLAKKNCTMMKFKGFTNAPAGLSLHFIAEDGSPEFATVLTFEEADDIIAAEVKENISFHTGRLIRSTCVQCDTELVNNHCNCEQRGQ